MKDAALNWNAAKVIGGNNSKVTFYGFSVGTEPSQLTTQPKVWVKRGTVPNDGAAMARVETTMYTYPYTGIARITIREGAVWVFLPDLTAVMAHELSHTFSLGDCYPACDGLSVMGAANCRLDASGNITYCKRGPTSCDNAKVIQYCEFSNYPTCPLPTPTPTPTPTPSTEQECQDIGWYWNFASNTCQATSGCPPGGPQRGDCEQGVSVWCESQCECVRRSSQCSGGTPIVVDVSGDGFDLTGGAGGVSFDLDSDGARERLAWTSARSDDAWLALDRDGSGTIDNGRELFGNFTPQSAPPPGEDMNGFLALAEYDKPERGGNGDGMIDSMDAIFASLLLWRDFSHDGISEASELNTLESLGVESVSLDYRQSRKKDRHGNEFRYRAKFNGRGASRAGKWAYDVFLLSVPAGN